MLEPVPTPIVMRAVGPAEGAVTYPLRSMFGSAANVRVLLAEVSGFDLAGRRVWLATGGDSGAPDWLE
jgi:NADH dehydrogenase FAD-containing subunit